MSRTSRRIDDSAWPFVLAATLAALGCSVEVDPYRTLTPFERHIYLEPTAVAIALSFTRVVGGYDSSCMLTGDGRAWYWGRNQDGALGAVTTGTCMGGNVPCTWQPVESQAALRFGSARLAQDRSCAQRFGLQGQ